MKEKTGKKWSTRKLTLMGMMIGMTIILTYTPLGLIPIPPINPTILHIPTVIIAILEGPIVGVIVGTSFGISTMVKAFAQASQPLDFLFMNPFVSVLPRIFIGLTSYYAYAGIKRLFAKANWKDSAGIVVGAAVGSMTNTIGVLGMMYLLYAQHILETIGIKAKVLVLSVASTSGIAEMIIAVIATLAVVKALKKALYK